MKDTLKLIFRNYSYLNDETILSSLLEKVDENLLKEIKNLDDLNSFLFQLVKQIDKNDILSIIFKLQSNIHIIDYAIKDHDDDLASYLKTLNSQNIKFIDEIIAMFDFRELERYDSE